MGTIYDIQYRKIILKIHVAFLKAENNMKLSFLKYVLIKASIEKLLP